MTLVTKVNTVGKFWAIAVNLTLYDCNAICINYTLTISFTKMNINIYTEFYSETNMYDAASR